MGNSGVVKRTDVHCISAYHILTCHVWEGDRVFVAPFVLGFDAVVVVGGGGGKLFPCLHDVRWYEIKCCMKMLPYYNLWHCSWNCVYIGIINNNCVTFYNCLIFISPERWVPDARWGGLSSPPCLGGRCPSRCSARRPPARSGHLGSDTAVPWCWTPGRRQRTGEESVPESEGWSIRLITSFCWHQNKTSLTAQIPYTLLGVQSWVRFCWQEFGEFPWPAWAVGS